MGRSDCHAFRGGQSIGWFSWICHGKPKQITSGLRLISFLENVYEQQGSTRYLILIQVLARILHQNTKHGRKQCAHHTLQRQSCPVLNSGGTICKAAVAARNWKQRRLLQNVVKCLTIAGTSTTKTLQCLAHQILMSTTFLQPLVPKVPCLDSKNANKLAGGWENLQLIIPNAIQSAQARHTAI